MDVAAHEEADLIEEVDRAFDEHIDLLRRLARCSTTLGNVRPAQEIVHRHLLQLGLSAQIADFDVDTIARQPGYAPAPWSSTGQPNVWGILPPAGPGGRSLVLNGHIDVVPPGPIDRWTYGPWDATVVGDRMYGRGVLDMKSGLVAGLLAIRAVVVAKIELRGPVIFESVIEEECTGNGMLAQRLRTGPADGAVILEPTGLATWVATLGVVWFEVGVEGKAAYVGQGGDFVNAIEVAASLIGRMKPAMVAELNGGFVHPAYAAAPAPLTLSVGAIDGGGWPSSVPLECRFTCRMSYPIGWSFEDASAFVERHVRGAASDDAWLAEHAPVVRFPGFRALGWESPEGSPLLGDLGGCHEAETGDPLARSAWPGTADARYFADAGSVAYYGPAGGNIHAPDEYVELESVRRAARVLARLIAGWCR